MQKKEYDGVKGKDSFYGWSKPSFLHHQENHVASNGNKERT